MSAYQHIRYDVADRIATITLYRPDKMNAFTPVMMTEMCDAFDHIDNDDAVRAVVVTGAGNRAFCAGADLNPADGSGPFASSHQTHDDPLNDDPLSDVRVRDDGGTLTLRMYNCSKPIIGAVNGVAVGIGATMLLAMDMRLASDTARFGFVFARRGIVPEAASSWFLPRIVGLPMALEWCMTGRIFDAQEAHRERLVRSLHPADQLLDAAYAVAREIADNTSAVSVAMTRAMLWRLSPEDHPMAAHRIDSRGVYRLAAGDDAQEGVASFLEKRPANFQASVANDMPDFYPWWEEPDYH